MQDFEKLGVFYLGKIINNGGGKDDLLFYDSKDFTTHAVCVGMTGSGKTGLGITILEEAGIDKIPAIIIDPKGDLGNLALTFPNLSSSDFLPWVDPAEAERKSLSLDAYAETTAKTWQDGLAKWGENAERIQKLRNAVDIVIYTPASRAGIPLSILSSFAAPPKEMLLDTGAVRDRVLSTTSSLLGLLGIDADPIKSREHILISTLIEQAWNKGQNLDIGTLIQQVQRPPFDKIGALDVDTFFPPKDRMNLSISLNNLLASPGFQAWMEGEPLDVKQLLYTKEGKPKLSVISIAHLSDSERMFFVTLLLNEVLTWMRRQPGTSSLRALLYMDEIFGYFPPIAMPPSKKPMLTLLKQARAYGLGIILATQNPVDLDYKGLSNCGTWFIGKLQTDRDKARVIEGLNVASNGEINAAALDKMIAKTGNRTFIMRSIYLQEPVLFQTRWSLSYLRGPLTLSQIESLTEKSPVELPEEKAGKSNISPVKPAIVPGIQEYFASLSDSKQPGHYKPQVLGIAKLHYIDSKSNVDLWQDICMVSQPDDDGKNVHWDEGKNLPEIKTHLEKDPVPNSTFEELPAGLMLEKNYAAFEKAFAATLYQSQELKIFRLPGLNLVSEAGESEGDFRSRINLKLREKRDEMVQKLRDNYAGRIATIKDKIRREQEKLAQKQHEAGLKTVETIISAGATLLGALFGGKVTKGTISQAGTSIRKAGRITKETQDASQAEDNLKVYQQQLEDLEAQLNKEITEMQASLDANTMNLETVSVKPRKSDISVEKVALVWLTN